MALERVKSRHLRGLEVLEWPGVALSGGDGSLCIGGWDLWTSGWMLGMTSGGA